jgi:flagellin-like hook-associated protein FlgL
MANWKDIAGASKSIGKTDSIDMKAENRDAMESVMVALAASGRVQEMALVAQTLEKVQAKADLAEALTDIGAVMREIKSTSDNTKDEIAKLKAENSRLRQQVEV